ncbi:MAG: tRNA (adenosine(37)-N6)-threonylcarbamoyltransferase complex transferase subunit TsaD [Pseudomonadota bacterium]
MSDLSSPRGATPDQTGGDQAPAGGCAVVLGIETSCDDTGVALVTAERSILAERLGSQLDRHAPFGGVVPEIAARAHLEILDRMIADVMAEAKLDFPDLAAIAVTAGPGLIGGLIGGLLTAKAIAAVHRRPLIAVNHLEAHALTARLTDADLDFPYLLLLVSGGHCQLLMVQGVGRYRRLGTTLDDALGEAYDKAAKMLGLGYPGGPAVEAAACSGDPLAYDFPRPMSGKSNCHFSFSGLKTALRQTVQRLGPESLEPPYINDLTASFQAAAIDSLLDRTARAIKLSQNVNSPPQALVVAGGVAANAYLSERLSALADSARLRLVVPPPKLCTDNGVMIAWTGIERLTLGLTDDLTARARARWPLDQHAEPVLGAGVKA